MSYIRCLSNPEGMYVYGTQEGKRTVVSFCDSPHDPKKELRIPIKDFHRVCRAFDKDGEDAKSGNFAVKDLKINEVTMKPWSAADQKAEDDLLRPPKPNQRLNDKEWVRRYKAHYKKHDAGWRIGVYWKGKLRFILWRVTWAYIARSGARD